VLKSLDFVGNAINQKIHLSDLFRKAQKLQYLNINLFPEYIQKSQYFKVVIVE
jgi:hypothetical protein